MFYLHDLYIQTPQNTLGLQRNFSELTISFILQTMQIIFIEPVYECLSVMWRGRKHHLSYFSSSILAPT